MKAIVRLKNAKRKEQIEVARTQLLARLLLNNKICLSEINQKLRINNSSLYITALRLAREENSVDHYIEVLNILHFDINTCKSNDRKAYLKNYFLTILS